jgi:hypothetical protein
MSDLFGEIMYLVAICCRNSISNDGVFRRKRQKDANGLFEGQQNSLIVQDA